MSHARPAQRQARVRAPGEPIPVAELDQVTRTYRMGGNEVRALRYTQAYWTFKGQLVTVNQVRLHAVTGHNATYSCCSAVKEIA
jgi:hypothetical protein